MRACVRHREDAWLVVSQVLVELVPDAVAGTAGTGPGRVAALRHEALYHPMEGRPVEVALTGQEHEVVHRLRRLIGEELYPDRSLPGAERRVVVPVGGDGHLGRLFVVSLGHCPPYLRSYACY